MAYQSGKPDIDLIRVRKISGDLTRIACRFLYFSLFV
jgi:hypothetical protein